jgi:tetratricopeptide (TPR) repeat protein
LKRNCKEDLFVDRHFLEFWGNLLINAAKSQKQMEDAAEWMNQGLKGFEDLTAMFRRFYDLDNLSESAPDYVKTWEKAAKDFQKSFYDYLKLFGVVPRQEHLELAKKYEALKKKVADQEEAIKHLRMLMGDKGADLREIVEGYQDLVKKQADQFREFMKSFTQALNDDTSGKNCE